MLVPSEVLAYDERLVEGVAFARGRRWLVVEVTIKRRMQRGTWCVLVGWLWMDRLVTHSFAFGCGH